MASLPVSNHAFLVENDEDNSNDLPEGLVRNTLDLKAFIIEPSPLGGGRPLTNDEFFQALHYQTRVANREALVSLARLVHVASQIQCVLHKTKLRRNVCIHSSTIREKFNLVAKTTVSAARGIFWFVFGDIRAASNVNFDAKTDVTVQRKQVEAIAASVLAIPEEINCEKLNRVVAENAALGYQI